MIVYTTVEVTLLYSRKLVLFFLPIETDPEDLRSEIHPRSQDMGRSKR